MRVNRDLDMLINRGENTGKNEGINKGLNMGINGVLKIWKKYE